MYSRLYDFQRQLEAGFDDVSTIIRVLEEFLKDMYCRLINAFGIEPVRKASREFELILTIVKKGELKDVPSIARSYLGSCSEEFVLKEEVDSLKAIVASCEALCIEGRFSVLRKLITFISVIAEESSS